jgi:hypothetical protein
VIASWRRYRALPPADRLLLREALTLLTLVRLGLVIFPFASVRRMLHGSAPSESGEANVPARVAWAMAALTRRTPGPTTCLAQALVADALLRRRGARSALRIGVRKRAEASPGPIAAHAWVECGDLVVVGRLDDLSEYSVLTAPEPQ